MKKVFQVTYLSLKDGFDFQVWNFAHKFTCVFTIDFITDSEHEVFKLPHTFHGSDVPSSPLRQRGSLYPWFHLVAFLFWKAIADVNALGNAIRLLGGWGKTVQGDMVVHWELHLNKPGFLARPKTPVMVDFQGNNGPKMAFWMLYLNVMYL